jgi:hypothetical protein
VRPELGFPDSVEDVLMIGMARDRNKRYRTAPEFAAALTDAASGKETHAESRAGSTGARWWRKLLGR